MEDTATPALEAGETAIVETPAVEETTEGQPVEGQPAEAEAEDAEEKRSRSQERRERRKARMEQLRQDAEAAQKRLERLERAAQGEKEPSEAEFADLTEYAIAKAAWKLQQGTIARERDEVSEAAKAAQAERARELAASYQDQIAEAKGRYVDFDAVVNNPRVYIAPHVAELVISSDQAADLAYAVASKPDLAARISSLPPIEAARELGRLEASLTAPRRVTSSAPPPITPVSARSQAGKNPADMSYEEYKAWRKRGSR
jgi:hypothetical protein